MNEKINTQNHINEGFTPLPEIDKAGETQFIEAMHRFEPLLKPNTNPGLVDPPEEERADFKVDGLEIDITKGKTPLAEIDPAYGDKTLTYWSVGLSEDIEDSEAPAEDVVTRNRLYMVYEDHGMPPSYSEYYFQTGSETGYKGRGDLMPLGESKLTTSMREHKGDLAAALAAVSVEDMAAPRYDTYTFTPDRLEEVLAILSRIQPDRDLVRSHS